MIDNNGRYEGVYAKSMNEYEIILYLNQMGVFNFVDDGTLPGKTWAKNLNATALKFTAV